MYPPDMRPRLVIALTFASLALAAACGSDTSGSGGSTAATTTSNAGGARPKYDGGIDEDPPTTGAGW